MVSPIRKYDGHSPRKQKHHVNKEEDADNLADTSFDLIDQSPMKSYWYSVRVPGALPHKRSFHASVITNDMLYIIGGLDLMEDTYKDVWRISIKSLGSLLDGTNSEDGNMWEPVRTTGNGPGRISNHKAVAIETRIYVYGGLIDNENCKDSLFWFDITSSTWTNYKVKEGPLGRDGHTMVKSELNNSIYVFGGYIESRCTNELWIFNTDRNFWKRITYEYGPSARAYHSADMWTHDDPSVETIIVVGGVNEDLERLRDIWLYSVKDNAWKEVQFYPEDTLLLARSEHSSTIYGNDLIVFGGRDATMKELNDVMVLNLSTLKWKQSSALCLKPTLDKSFSQSMKESPKLKAISKISDASFAAAANNESQKSPSPVAHNYSPQRSPQRAKREDGRSPSPTSAKAKLKGPPPKLRAADIESALEEKKLLTPTTSSMLHSVVIHAGEKSLEPYVQSMRKRKRAAGLYPTKSGGESDYCVRGRVPCGRSGHSANLYENFMIIFGGDRGQVALNDIYMYELKGL